MSARRFIMFLLTVLSIWAAMHLYVVWRLAAVPFTAGRASPRWLAVAAAVLAAGYPLARAFGSRLPATLGWLLEFITANWIGVLFLLVVALLAADLITLGGWVLSRWAPAIRGWAAVAALAVSVVALVQGLRAPVVREYEVRIAGLPPERDGLQVVLISDTHLGALIGQGWMERLIDRINAMKPDLVFVDGDLVDSDAGQLGPLVPILRKLQAPLGVYAVTGNHEFYAGLDRSVRLFEQAGFTVLRDQWAEIFPGLVVAGVDDLTARRQFGLDDEAVKKALANRSPGAAILLTHTPLEAETAAAAGAQLMLSGHTHNGQIWPFSFLSATRYPLQAGRYDVGGMPVIVSRGAGAWGPRMRFPRPGEILRIHVRSAGFSP